MSYTFPEFTTTQLKDGFSPEDDYTKNLYNEVEAFAKQGQPIVIFGPTGAGKEFLSRHYYKTLVKTEFYEQYKENWPSEFEALRKIYAAYYSGQSLDIFLNSIMAGTFESINAATIYPNLAESILFGHEANSFTGAATYPGLLESIKYGVLFMDEIGELPKDLQVKFLRAIDSEIYEGRRIAGKMNYSLKDMIIISATNQPREKIRDDFYFKMGIEVEIKGIDERPKDVRKSIPHFICKAIGKRKDYAAIINMFGIRGLQDVNNLAETEEVQSFAMEISELITNEILIRKWPGNFRALRIALEASVLRIESTRDVNTFSEQFHNNLQYYITKYSDDTAKTAIVVEEPVRNFIYPSPYPDLDNRILEEIVNKNVFQEMEDFEKNVLAVFLSTTSKRGFKRKDLEGYYGRHEAIKHTSEAHIRSKINQLLDIKILRRTGDGKSTRYYLTNYFLDRVQIQSTDIFSLPKVKDKWTGRIKEIDTLDKVLHTSERVYIQSAPRNGKSAFITMFCNAREKGYNFYYYPLGEAGINKLFKDIQLLLQSENIELNSDEILLNPVNVIHPFLEKIFKIKEGAKPVLILDNAHYISDPVGIKTIVDLTRKWEEVKLILIGDTMDNSLLEDFHELPLGSWSRQM